MALAPLVVGILALLRGHRLLHRLRQTRHGACCLGIAYLVEAVPWFAQPPRVRGHPLGDPAGAGGAPAPSRASRPCRTPLRHRTRHASHPYTDDDAAVPPARGQSAAYRGDASRRGASTTTDELPVIEQSGAGTRNRGGGRNPQRRLAETRRREGGRRQAAPRGGGGTLTRHGRRPHRSPA
ncbi:hypothetical protein QJS66_15275 [Kocuria rhizophila]|nr:hypothetical protein QJS66_15275 [Kocuria rhizophila]